MVEYHSLILKKEPGEYRTFIDGKEATTFVHGWMVKAVEIDSAGDVFADSAFVLQKFGDVFKARNTTNAFVHLYDDLTIDSVTVHEMSPLEFFGYDTSALDDPDIRWLYQKYIWLTPVRLIRRLYRAWRNRQEWRW